MLKKYLVQYVMIAQKEKNVIKVKTEMPKEQLRETWFSYARKEITPKQFNDIFRNASKNDLENLLSFLAGYFHSTIKERGW